MAITRFESFVGVQTGGTADVDKLAAAFDKLSGSITDASEKSKKVNEHPGFEQFAQKVKQGIADPLGTLGNVAEGALKALGPVGVGVAGLGATLVAFGAAGLSAARSLGEWSDQLGDTAVRLGETVEGTAKLQFAMKYAGGDIAGLEAGTKKLSQALSASSAEGKDAREGLRALGIVTRDETGKMVPMSNIWLQLSESLGRIPDVATRNALAIKVLGRSALDVLPDLLNFAEGLKKANERDFSSVEEQAKRAEELRKQVVEIDATWAAFVRKVKMGIAVPVLFVFGEAPKGVSTDAFDMARAGRGVPQSTVPDEDMERLALYSGVKLAPGAEANAAVNQALAQRTQEKINAAKSLGAFLDDNSKLDNANQKLEDLKKKLDEARVNAEQMVKSGSILPEVAEKARREVELQESAYKRQSDLIKLMQKDEEHRLAILEKQRDLIFQQTAFYTVGTGGRGSAVITQADIDKANSAAIALERLQSIPRTGPTAEELRGYSEIDLKPLEGGIQNKSVPGEFFVSPSTERQGGPAFLGGEYQRSGADEAAFGLYRIDEQKKALEFRIEKIHDISDFETRIAELHTRPGGELDTAKTFADIRLNALQEEFTLTGDIERLRAGQRQVELEFQYKIGELQRRRLEEVRNLGANFFDAVLGGGRGIQDFARNILLDQGRKIAGNLATELFGKESGHIGIPGKIFEGTFLGKDPLKDAPLLMATDLNSRATDRNTQAIDNLTMAMARTGAISPSGGGGSFSPAFSTFAGVANRVQATGEEIGAGRADTYGLERDSSGLWRRGTDLDGGWGSGEFDGPETSGIPKGAPGDFGGEYFGGGGSKFTAMKGVGIAGAALGGAFGVYSGVKQGGARGAVTAGGSLAAASAGILSLAGVTGPAAPILAGVGMALGLVTSLFGDPKAERQKEIDERLSAARYIAPTSTAYSVDRYGRSFDSDISGNIRPIQINVSTMDPKTFFIENRHLVAQGTRMVLDGKEDPALNSSLRITSFRR